METLSHHPHHHSIANGLGLLTTVAQLPPKYRNRYLNIKTKIEIPLDLSIKPISPYDQTESTSTDSASSYYNNDQPPITPPPSPPKKRTYSHGSAELSIPFATGSSTDETTNYHHSKRHKVENPANAIRDITPSKPIKCDAAPKTSKVHPQSNKPTRNKATRKLKFDEDTSSPVSGTVIRPLEEINGGILQFSNGDIDPKYNIVEITEETKAELAAIKNVIGDYVCRLCRLKFEDAFGLAQHRCSCIVLLEYRCPECGKQFNCPANLASHRRWHKPKKTECKKENQGIESNTPATSQFICNECGKHFKRAAYLRKHKLTHKKLVSQSTTKSKGKCDLYTGTAQTIHSYEDESNYTNEYDMDSTSDSSSSSGRLQIVEHNLTEEENIAATALTNLRNCTSVIQHTTVVAMAH